MRDNSLEVAMGSVSPLLAGITSAARAKPHEDSLGRGGRGFLGSLGGSLGGLALGGLGGGALIKLLAKKNPALLEKMLLGVGVGGAAGAVGGGALGTGLALKED